MWFVFVGVGLALVVICGIYVRRRIAGALSELGVGTRRVRFVRWGIAWLLFGFPIVMIVAVVTSLALGRDTVPRFDGPVGVWLLLYPFAWAVLVAIQSVVWLVAIDVGHVIVRRRRGAAVAARLRAFGVLAVVGAFALYTPIRIIAQRGDLRVRHHQVGPARAGVPPIRIAFVADVQQDAHTDAARAREVYELVNAGGPDLILSAGDWINAGPEHIASAAATAGVLRSRLGTYSVRGDHEHFAYFDRERSVTEVERALRDHGVAMVSNGVRWFEHHGKRVAVVFLNYNYVVKADRATIEALLASLAGADYTIAVTHQLDRDLADALADRVDLVLVGHTHGGQVNPVIGVVHVNLARLETRFVDGRYTVGRTTIIVTAGVGYSVIPVRYAAPGSIERIELAL